MVVSCLHFFFFCLTYPRRVAEETGNLEMPVNVDKRSPSRCLLSPVKGAAQQDRNLFDSNRSSPAKHYSRSVVPLLPLPVWSLDIHPCVAFTRSPSLSARMVSEKAKQRARTFISSSQGGSEASSSAIGGDQQRAIWQGWGTPPHAPWESVKGGLMGCQDFPQGPLTSPPSSQ